MNLVDSCGWLEYLADGPNADYFSGPLLDTDNLLVPAICIHEVFKKILSEAGEDRAMQMAAAMMQSQIVDLDADLAVESARLSHKHKLPLADGVILAAAERFNAMIYTQDRHFRGLPNVRYIEKKSG
ncbi:MAG: type II toxin-antitoxin system VapC family toxin [Candidatus Wallbacteria bacterium]|nr:type II toxin-antitoxin system VapC family toxin [Candidatus Wallbacteria bacterium]